jgi:bifunctional DNase/RNase
MEEMLAAEIWTIAQSSHGNVVLLRPKNLEVAVPIFIGLPELHSILIGKEGISLPRPMTHDLFFNLLRRVNLNLQRVEIHELKNDTFYARLVLTGKEYTDSTPLVLDSRPSDALALAVRKRRPIYISSKVITQTGVPLEYFLDEADKEARTSPDRYQDLLKQLNRAVAAEEYEKAAELRDMLILLEREREDPEPD